LKRLYILFRFAEINAYTRDVKRANRCWSVKGTSHAEFRWELGKTLLRSGWIYQGAGESRAQAMFKQVRTVRYIIRILLVLQTLSRKIPDTLTAFTMKRRQRHHSSKGIEQLEVCGMALA
jgi:hypothetical protein